MEGEEGGAAMSHILPFIPMNSMEASQRGWDELDVIFVSGDACIDHPAFGVPLLARWLESHGFRVGIIAQPDWRKKESFTALGRPRLFFAVSAGAMDSMVAHYTPEKRIRRDDAYTPGGRHGARPNRATIVYTSCCKGAYSDVPVVIGGIEASLRRFAHYDYWDNAVRRSILFDSKADLLVFGMGERPLLELAERLRRGEQFAEIRDIRGTACINRCPVDRGIQLPSFDAVATDRQAYATAYRTMAGAENPVAKEPLVQIHGDRWLICNPPARPLAEHELDSVYALPFTRLPHPSYSEPIPAWEQIKASITTHRGCYGGCAFCAITHHQGKTIQSRSQASIISEAQRLASSPWFRGSITDLGGPTANMYGTGCASPDRTGDCRRPSCLYPSICRHLLVNEERGVALLEAVRRLPGVKNLSVTSGVRYDLLPRQKAYFRALVAHHVGGLLKVAPEHSCQRVLRVMRKPASATFLDFLALFREESCRIGKRQAIVPYLMAGHPGTTLADMVELALFLRKNRIKVEQVQEFTPTPGTLATCIYHTGIDPSTGEAIYVARSDREKRQQKALLLAHIPAESKRVKEALKDCGREDLTSALLGFNVQTSTGRREVKGRNPVAKTGSLQKKRNKP